MKQTFLFVLLDTISDEHAINQAYPAFQQADDNLHKVTVY